MLLVSLVALCGCTRHYVLKLNNGLMVTTASKPKLKNGYYCFKDGLGQENRVPAGRVREIEPASMAREESGRFKPTPSK